MPADKAARPSGGERDKRLLGLYLHFPFCVRKCLYCDFLSAPAGEARRQEYTEVLCGQIRDQAQALRRDYLVDSVFIGGGTPSLMTPTQLKSVFAAVRESFNLADDCEITMESNPGTLDREKLEAMREAGVNRLSIGLQSACDEELKLLGRIHTFAEFAGNYALARELGFDNINVDLMSSLPGQTADSFAQTLDRVLPLGPEHLSVYSLIIEPGTVFEQRYAGGRGLPDEDTVLAIDELVRKRLKEAGYERYGISNYAKPCFACRHNLKYWHSDEYLAFGTGAVSLMRTDCGLYEPAAGKRGENPEIPGQCARKAGIPESRLMRIENKRDMDSWKHSPVASLHCLSLKEEREEFCITGFRLTGGISLDEYERRFGERFSERCRGIIEKYSPMGLMEEKEGFVRLTEPGLEVSNIILEEFLEDESDE